MLRSEEKAKLVGWMWIPPGERGGPSDDWECAGCGTIAIGYGETPPSRCPFCERRVARP